MCHFISGFVSVRHNQIVIGNPKSHSDATVHSGMDDWREFELIKDGKVDIRVTVDDDKSAYLATIMVLLDNKLTRVKLAKLYSPSTNKYGDKFYWNKNGYHRTGDQPAIICADGSKEWLVDGKRHRNNDQPAIIWAGGSKEWWVDGKRHRNNDQPAIIWADGTKEWWIDGKLHREDDKPATIYADGSKEWWVNNKLVRSEELEKTK